MLSLQVKSLPKEYFLMILPVLDAFTSGEIPLEGVFPYDPFGLGCFHFR